MAQFVMKMSPLHAILIIMDIMYDISGQSIMGCKRLLVKHIPYRSSDQSLKFLVKFLSNCLVLEQFMDKEVSIFIVLYMVSH